MNRFTNYDKVVVWHSFSFCGIVLISVILNAAGLFGSVGQQLILLAILLPITGIPHGALDYRIAGDLLEPRLGRLWSFVFVAIYILAMMAVLLAWRTDPATSLAVFLAITAFHFGTGDTLTTIRTPLTIRAADLLGRGGIVITFPAVFSQNDVSQLFSYLVPANDALWLTKLLAAMAPFASIAFLCSIGWYMFRAYKFEDHVSLSRALEMAAIAIAFSVMPALLAFTIYFSFLHSLRHMLYVAGSTDTREIMLSFGHVWRRSLPVTFATVILGIVAYFFLASANFDIPVLTMVIFIGIASMTYPHVAVILLAQRERVLKIQSLMLSV